MRGELVDLVDKVSSDKKVRLVVVTEGYHNWSFDKPNKKRLREVCVDGKKEGKGNLLGSDIEVGRCLGVEIPDRPRSLISTPVAMIIIVS